MSEFLKDVMWAYLMFKIRRYRRDECLYSKRTAFDKLMQEKTTEIYWTSKTMLAYPDAVYFYEWKWFDDVKRHLGPQRYAPRGENNE